MIRTLYIGLGGLGMQVISAAKKSQNYDVNSYVALDCNDYEIRYNQNIKEIPFVNMRGDKLVGDYIQIFKSRHNIEEWFPISPYILHSTLGNIGMVRAAGRLSFLYTMESGNLKPIEDLLKEQCAFCKIEDELNIVIVTSLAGGTGSGVFIQLALWIRNQMKKIGCSNFKILGLFVGSEVFINTYICLLNNNRQTMDLRANTYAALKELEVITKIMQSGDSSLLPFSISLDMLFDSSVIQETSPVFDSIYIYDYDANEALRDSSPWEERVAKILCTRFPLLATESTVQIQGYIDSLPELKKAYQKICNYEKQQPGDGFGPHIDKRLNGLFGDNSET
ncbi:MAG: hypothetical protein J6S71_04020 [Clostridia bacterium]|nr:hypothetical protein [Clostridia bacterium]